MKLAFFLKRPLSDLLITNIAKVLIQFGQTHNICIMAWVDCMVVHSAIKKSKEIGVKIARIRISEGKSLPCVE